MFEGALCSFGEEIQTQNLNVYTINEVMIEVLNKQAVENKVHRTLKLERWQGPPHINKLLDIAPF